MGGELGEEDVKMRVVSTPRKALQRQVEEAVRIEEEEEGNIMNSKKGYGTNKIPRIKVMMGDDVRGKRDEREREREKREEREQREREKKREEEDKLNGMGGDCVWQAQDEWEMWREWRETKMGCARTRGRRENETKGGWWGGKDGGGCMVWGKVALAPCTGG